MRRLATLALLSVCLACPPAKPPNPPPSTSFYFPTGLLHLDVPGFPQGVLVVSNSNFDRRFDHGSLMAVDLSKVGDGGVGLPAFGASVGASGPVQLPALNVPASGIVQVASFGGELALLPLDGGLRLFLPTRSEGNNVYAIDARVKGSELTLSCIGAGEAGGDCSGQGLSLTANESTTETGVPAAPGPQGVAVAADGTVWVSHMTQADSPHGSVTNLRGYLVHFDGRAPSIGDSSFVDIGEGSTQDVVVGQRWTYASGRFITPAARLVRLAEASGAALNSGLESAIGVLEGRGIALSSDESRLYVVGRVPDQLVVASISEPTSASPRIRVLRTLALPEGPTTVTRLQRPGKSDLIAIVCSTSGSLVIYDDDRGELVAQVSGLGQQPYAVAVDQQGAGARLFVSNFTDGRVAVIDMPDLSRPQDARLVAHLGASQLCLTRGERGGACDGGT
ncbi:MAG: hypothetical protein K1X89_03420 [Myxococcaceae bacterium]|nr:hypothetical protein [Myxococcaceae bacterium]